MKRYIIVEMSDVLAICKDQDGRKCYIVAYDLPPGATAGTHLFEDKSGKLKIDQINTKRNK